MGQLVAEHGLEFRFAQSSENRADQNDVGLVRKISNSGVETGGIVGLVKGDRDGEIQLIQHFASECIKLRFRGFFKSIGGFKQIQAHGVTVLFAHLVRGEPFPELGFFFLQIVHDSGVIGQWM